MGGSAEGREEGREERMAALREGARAAGGRRLLRAVNRAERVGMTPRMIARAGANIGAAGRFGGRAIKGGRKIAKKAAPKTIKKVAKKKPR